jgi:hypothetical protein
MRKILLSLLAAGTALAVATPALARDNCGRGYHRGWHDRCVPNGPRNAGPRYDRGPAVRLVIGNFYQGRGYWDGRRYYQNRYRHNNGWRYR